MFHVPDLNEVAFTDEYTRSRCYSVEHNDVNLDDVIRLDELQADADCDYPDFCEPVDDE